MTEHASNQREERRRTTFDKMGRSNSGKGTKGGSQSAADARAERANERASRKVADKEKDQAKTIQEMQATIDSLRAENQAKFGNSGARSRKNRSIRQMRVSLPVNHDIKEKAMAITNNKIWRNCKFLSCNDHLYQACEQVMQQIPDMASLLVNPDTKDDYIMAFAENYGDSICKVINSNRTNTMSALKKAYVTRHCAGKSCPTPKQLGDVICRKNLEYDENDPTKNAEQREWFMWYWEELLPKVTGKYVWGHSIRNYGTISAHTYPDDPKKKYITSSDEALVLTCYENGGQRFPYSAKCEKNGRKPDKSSAQFTTRWSDAAVGQNKWGGWSAEGRKRYNTLRSVISKAKRKPHVAAVESFALKAIQKKNGINQGKAEKTRAADVLNLDTTEATNWSILAESDDETVGVDVASDIEVLEDNYKTVRPKKKAKTSGNKKAPGKEKDEDDEESDGGENSEEED